MTAMKDKLHKIAALGAGAVAVLAIPCAPLHAQTTPGQLQTYTDTLIHPFHPFSWQQYRGMMGVNANYNYSTAINSSNSATFPANNYTGIFASSGTPMVVPNSAFADAAVQQGTTFAFPNPLFQTTGSVIDDILNRWELIDPTFTPPNVLPATQINGSLLGDYYDPTNFEPPYSRNVFRDWDRTGWSAPNKYVNGLSGAENATVVDDNNTWNGLHSGSNTFAPNGFSATQQAVTRAWPLQSSTTTANDEDTVVAANTATAVGAGKGATWTITGSGGQFELYVYVPTPAADQHPVPDALYTYLIDGVQQGTFYVNQTTNFGSWYDSGVALTLATADTLTVRLDSTSTFGTVALTPITCTLDSNSPTVSTDAFDWDPFGVEGSGTTTVYASDGSYYTVEIYPQQSATPSSNAVTYGVTGEGIAYGTWPVNGTAPSTAGSSTAIDQSATRYNHWVQLDMEDASGNEQLAVPFKYTPPTDGSTWDSKNYLSLAGSGAVAGGVRITKVSEQTIYAGGKTDAGGSGQTSTTGWTVTGSGAASIATALPTTAPAVSVTFQWLPVFAATDVPQSYNVLVHIPSSASAASTNPGITDAQYVVVAGGINYVTAPINQQTSAGKWVALRYPVSTSNPMSGKLIEAPFAALGTLTQAVYNTYNYVQLANGTSNTYSSQLVYADAVQFVAVPGSYDVAADAVKMVGNGLTVDDVLAGSAVFKMTGSWVKDTTAPDYYGSDYLKSTSPSSSTATWLPTLPTTGLYSVYAWFPSNTSGETHVTNAQYSINVPGATTQISAISVDQTYGGSWQFLAGPLSFASLNSSGSVPSVTVSCPSPLPSSGAVLVADAIMFVNESSAGATYSSAVVANITDYPEIFYGYDFNTIATVTDLTSTIALPGSYPAYPGGGYANYISDTVYSGVSYGNLPLVHNNNIIFTQAGATTTDPPITTIPPYYAANPATPITEGDGVTATGNTSAITQLVYFARNENVASSGNAATTVAGTIYCVDGLTGDIVWKYPDDYTPALERPGFISGTPVLLRNVLTRVNQPWYETGDPGYVALGTGGTIVPTGQVNNRGAYGTFNSVTDFIDPPNWPSGTPALNWQEAAYPAFSTTGDVYQPRTVLVVGDDNGKLFCIDAAGNGDGNDIIHDSTSPTPYPVSFDSSGNPYTSAGTPTGTLSVTHVGTTRCYWCWQPDSSSPLAQGGGSTSTGTPFDDVAAGTPSPSNAWTTQTVSGAYDGTCQTHTVTSAGGGDSSTFAWTLTLTTAGVYGISVQVPDISGVTYGAAEYTFTDASGATHVCTLAAPQGQAAAIGSPYALTDAKGNTTFSLGTTTQIVLDATIAAANSTLVADVVFVNPGVSGEALDYTRNLITPSSYQLNGPTAALTQDTAWGTAVASAAAGTISPAIVYDPKLFIGNSNGVLYSIDGKGTLANPANSVVNPKIYDLSLDQTFPTVTVNWWFNTGSSIAYAPVFDPLDNIVIATTYNSSGNNQGRVYAVNADYGPVGNGGVVPASQISTGATGTVITPVPDTYNYNINPIPYWSFPDGFGSLVDTNGNPLGTVPANLNSSSEVFPENFPYPNNNVAMPVHLLTSKVANGSGNLAILPLGDIAGAPALYTNPNSTTRYIYVACNDPLTNLNGRIMALDTSGQFQWSFPHTNVDTTTGSADPNCDATVETQQAQFTADLTASNTLVIDGAFTTQLSSPSYFVSSSPAIAMITAPSSDPYSPFNSGSSQSGSPADDAPTPVLYVGNTNGDLYEIALAPPPGASFGADKPNSANYDSDILYGLGLTFGGAGVVSAPAVISGSAGNLTTGKRGGVAWFNGANDGLTETEAAPYQYNGTAIYGNRDANLGGDQDAALRPGGLSSPTLGGFDIFPMTQQHLQTSSSGGYTTGDILTDISEWVYSGSDGGQLFGFTANASIGAGTGAGSVNPANFIPIENAGESLPGLVDLTRNLITSVSPDGTLGPDGTSDATAFGWCRNFTPVKAASGAPSAVLSDGATVDPKTDPNPVTEWGQTFYVKVFGLDNPANTGTSASGVPMPKPLYVKFSLSNISTGSTSSYVESRTVTPDRFYPIGDAGPSSAWWTTPGGPPWLASSATTSSIGNYVAIYPVVMGNGSTGELTPTLKIKVTDVEYHYLLNGQEHVIRAHVDPGTLVNNGKGGLTLTTPIDQATFGILNPLAVRGAGLPFDISQASAVELGLSPAGENPTLTSVPIRDLGPFQSFDNMVPVFKVYKYASCNGNEVPRGTTPPSGGTATGSGGTIISDPKKLMNTSSGVSLSYFTMIVATTTAGLLGHGAVGDNSTATALGAGVVAGDPATINSEGTTTPNIIPTTANGGGGFGKTLLNVADRSALGVNNEQITSLRMTSTKLAWNCNPITGTFTIAPNGSPMGSGAVINRLPWDSYPTSYTVGTNQSIDYPDITQYAVTATLQRRSSYDGSSPGTTAGIVYAAGTLANTSSTVSSTNNRDVNPQSVQITVNVPKYQPANLEAYSNYYASQGIEASGINHLHPDAGSTSDPAPGADIPNGYVGLASMYIDSGNTGTMNTTKAYRNVQIWTGVQADMNSITIDQPTTDIGAVPAGFGIEDPLDSVWASVAVGTDTTGLTANSASWSPFSGTSNSRFAHWYQAVTAHNTGNVNLLNIHFDQYLNYSTAAAGGWGVPYKSVSALNLTNDGASGNSFIPSVDTVAGTTGLLTAGPNAQAGLMPVVRSSADYFDQYATWNSSANHWDDSGSGYLPYWNAYIPNGAELSSKTGEAAYNYPGPTWHKPRIGDSALWGATFTVPDQPHDALNPLTSAQATGSPKLSVAVPMGTPSGTYSQALRLFEGYDAAPLSSGAVSTAYTGPLYGGQAVPIQVKSTASPYALSLDASTNTILQPYSQTPTQIKVTVTEARITSGTTSNAHLEASDGTNLSASLPMVDFDDNDGNLETLALTGAPTGTNVLATPIANDLQPVGFPAALDLTSSSVTSSIGLVWASARYDSSGDSRIAKAYLPYDVLGAAVLSAPLNGTAATAATSTTAAVQGSSGWGSLVNTAAQPSSASVSGTNTGLWWTPPFAVTSFGASLLAGTSVPASQAYDPFVLVSRDGTNNQLLHVEARSQSVGMVLPTTYTIVEQPIQGAIVRNTTSNAWQFATPGTATTLVTSSQQIFHPRAVWYYDNIGLKSYEIVIFTQRVNNTSTLMYVVYDPNAASGNPTVSTPAVLPTPAGLSDLSDASPVVRYIVTSLGSSTWTSDQPGANNVQSFGEYIDVTFAGRSEHSSSTDIFTCRYTVTPASTVGPWLSIPNIHSAGYTNVGMSPHGGLITQKLLVGANKATYVGRDACWSRDPSNFTLYLKSSTGVVDPMIGPNAPSTVSFKTDPNSGAWVFTSVPVIANATQGVYWNYNANGSTSSTSTTTMTVTVDPFAGTVSFSVPPDINATDANHLTWGIYADVLPQALRVTNGMGSNSQPCAFLDDAPKANASVNLTTVQTARYWQIYRKSGTESTGASTASSTLYYNTRRLAITLTYPIALSSISPVAVVAPTVIVTDGTTTRDVSAYVDVDWERGRIYFPEQFEGLSARVTYTPAPFGSGTTSAQRTEPSATTYSVIQWTDEPFSNSPQDAATIASGTPAIALTGERTVPIYNAVNEGEPSAFLDPAAYLAYISGATTNPGFVGQTSSLSAFNGAEPLNNPHKVWMFWSSNRNGGKLNSTPVATTIMSLKATTTSGVTTTTITVASTANITSGVYRIGRGDSAEDIAVAVDGSGNITTTYSVASTYVGKAFGNVRLSDYVQQASASTPVTYTYWKPVVDNPGNLPWVTGSDSWLLYTGMTDVYWQTIDPRFQISP
ncbi:MAG: hypothetical protein P4L33_17115 [Capsulimonadaceae bacterium]|nr:hypothetical protein [Capsulimonadaceae bacterium]